MVNKQASEGNILVNENLQKAKLITAPNESVAASWIELPESLTDEQLIDEYCKHIWDYPLRPIRVIVNNEALNNLAKNPATSEFIPYVHKMGIPIVQSLRGLEIYLEEILPMPGVEDVTGTLEYFGCKFELKQNG